MNTKIPFFIDLSKEFAMARFIPTLSLSAAPGTAQHISMHHAPAAARDAEASRTLAGMLLAAVMAALLVVADQVIDTWADGHLLAGWVALWTVAFAALALLAPPMRQVSSFMAVTYDRWAQASRLRRQEEVMWEYARKDPRVMAELQAAWRRERDEPLPYELDTLRASSTH